MWVRFKVWWQDGLYQYNPGKVVDLPSALARGYCGSGKAVECNPPKWAVAEVTAAKKRKIPSAKSTVRRIKAANRDVSDIRSIADEVMQED